MTAADAARLLQVWVEALRRCAPTPHLMSKVGVVRLTHHDVQAVLRTCITTTIAIYPPPPQSNRLLAEPPAAIMQVGTPVGGGRAPYVPDDTSAMDDTGDGQPVEPVAAELYVVVSAVHVAASPGASATQQLPSSNSAVAPDAATLQIRWPRRLGSIFRVSVACAKRLQGVIR